MERDQESKNPWILYYLKAGPTGCIERSVRSDTALYPEEGRSHLLHGGSLKSHKCRAFVDTVMNAAAT
jgi:hypothetical protein